jgi:hypothetical protein
MFRPGGRRPYTPRATVYGGGTVPPLPVTADMLATLTQAIAGGVTQVWYGDRRVNFMSLDDLLKAWDWIAGQLGLLGADRPRRSFACFAKGLNTGGGYYGLEHQEVADALFSRQVPPDPTRTGDVDWERAR